MLRFLVKKSISLLLSLFAVATITFFLMRASPGDPFTDEKAIPPEIMQSLVHHYGLDSPWYVQYGKYLKGIVTCDLGPSFKYEGQTVNTIIRTSFPVSFLLGAEALCMALSGGILFGSLAALNQGKWQDHLLLFFGVLGISVPSFILATFLQYLFAIKWHLLPVARWESVWHSLLPALSLAALPMAFITRLTRTSVLEVLSQDYIQTAKSKGLSTFQVISRHALRNSLLPVVTYLGPLTASLLTGSFIIEKIFGIPGLGGWFVLGVANRDYTIIMGITVFYSVILMGSVFLVDILYRLLDPRIQSLKVLS